MGILKDMEIVLLLATNQVFFSPSYQIGHNICGETFSLFISVNSYKISTIVETHGS